MSCGPDQKQLKAVNAVNTSVERTSDAINNLPKKVAGIPGYASVQLAVQINEDLKNLKELIDDPFAVAEALIPSLPEEFLQYIALGNSLAGDSIEFLDFVNKLDQKYGDFDYGDPEDILQAINDIGGDITRLCEVVPNVQKRKGEFIKKGAAVSGKTDQIANPVKQTKLPSIELAKEYIDGFKKDEVANNSELDAAKEQQTRFTAQQ